MLLTQNVYRLLVASEKQETKITPNYLIGVSLLPFIYYRQGKEYFNTKLTFCKLVSKVKQQSGYCRLAYLLTYSLIYLLMYYSLTYLLTYLLFNYLFIYLFTYIFTSYLLIYLIIYLFIYFFTYLITYLLIYLLI